MVFAKIVETEKELQDAFFVREEVFVKEQGIPRPLEKDEYDDIATHFVAYFDHRPIAAGRVRFKDLTAIVDRVCVIPPFRRKQIGVLMMQSLEQYIQGSNIKKVKLNAQTHAIPFYEKQNYCITSPEFLDAGVPYRAMEKVL
ncbi:MULTISPECIES: GNAT family N-acetyltransferase [unclassified Rummeliibacillus]|uniref:GNAT family N-acetyltransferase n=1 Tax=unclassified Rummeliibacillus TaxID=2622809 RepID=UPI000E65FEF7|nr:MULTISPECIES: GNAT family N-acetyltransferase [unclassified Rummeliibacillus]RIJ67680.1 GNAT family N-acetyltransferase [Rummeliibacillus sp. POC4]RPJ96244.1 GNAT family N-acetyltransferase [Rummeliibacillus sp. TYF005]